MKKKGSEAAAPAKRHKVAKAVAKRATEKRNGAAQWISPDPFIEELRSEVSKLGGARNAHAHLDRADTLAGRYLADINLHPIEASNKPLTVKQDLVGDLHRGPAYRRDDLQKRVSDVLRRQMAYDVRRVVTCCDVSPQLGEDGLIAWNVMQELKAEFAGLIDLRVGPSPIFGMKEGTERWETYQRVAEQADHFTGLPEKDDIVNWRERDGKVGFETHCRRLIELGFRHNKEVHLHLDQTGSPHECGTERLIKLIDTLEPEVIEWIVTGKPKIWAVHMISPSAYAEPRFQQLLFDLKRLNIGVICCPSAAISMRRLRPIQAPLHNSIARVLELLKSDIPVLLGTDNIGDVFVPAGDGNPYTEVVILAHACRFYIPHVLAKLIAGRPLNNVDKTTLMESIHQDNKSFSKVDPSWVPAIS